VTSGPLQRRALIASHKPGRPIQTLAAVMSVQQCIRTELKKMASVLETKFTNHNLQAVQIFQSYASSPFLAIRKITRGVRFHNVESKSKRSKAAYFRRFEGAF
jgi:hypothetical protein